MLQRMKQYGLIENRDKRVECKERIKFLGYEIEFNKVKPSVERAQGILEYGRPHSKCLPKICRNGKLLQIVYKKHYGRNEPILWINGEIQSFCLEWEMEDAFLKVKVIWRNELKLTISDFTKSFVLETDASNIGLSENWNRKVNQSIHS